MPRHFFILKIREEPYFRAIVIRRENVKREFGEFHAETMKADIKISVVPKTIVDHMKVNVSLCGTTIPHEVIGEYGAGRVMLKPAPEGTGIIACGTVRAVLEMAGIKNIRAKCLRSTNPTNVVKATFEGLRQLRTAEQVAAMRGKDVSEI